MSSTDAILQRLLKLHPKLIDLHLHRIERLLEDLGRPQDRMPPVIHVAGTNGKGSTVAFLRAFLEAAGKRVHVYTSPHLVRFNERIRLAGTLVSDEALNRALEECEQANAGQPITYFEITTAAAFKLFAETPADYLLLEVGVGGRYDATNVIAHPLGAVITPVAVDHVEFFGPAISGIAREKAGILKRGSPSVVGLQTEEGLESILREAARLGIRPFVARSDFDGYSQNGRLVYQDEDGLLDLPAPRLAGPHQFENAALAVAAVRHFRMLVSESALAAGLRQVDWPGRLMPLRGALLKLLSGEQELWLDGGHNAHGALALSEALRQMPGGRPLVLIVGMKSNRQPADILSPFMGFADEVLALAIPDEPNVHDPRTIAEAARGLGTPAREMPSLKAALEAAAAIPNARVVICGSLYLAGHALALNGTPPR